MSISNRSEEIAGMLKQQAALMRAGDKLPSVRELSKTYGASPVTITQAITALSALGVVRAEPGRGTFVSGNNTAGESDYAWQSTALGRSRVDAGRAGRLNAQGSADHVQLSWGYLAPELQPFDELRTLGARCAKSHRAWTMAPPMGLPDLRRVFAAELGADVADMLIMPGGQQSLVFAMRTLADPGTTLITESPSYPGATIAAQAAGLNLAAVPSDANGIRTDHLAETLERTRAKLIYLQPCYANPTGAVLSPERRVEVLALAKQYGAFIIEDDWARNLALEGTAPPPLFTQDPDGHVVSIATLSKPAAPGLRVGAIAARGPAGERLRTARIADDMCVPPLAQEIALGLLSSGAWPRHLKRLRAGLLERRDAMVAEVHASMPGARITNIPTGGIHLWVRLPEGSDSLVLTAAAHAAGVMIGDGRQFYVDEPTAPHIRLSFSAASIAQIGVGVRRVASLL
ncbi:PLP-dependent aminotransferase family protein [Arthrobacter psychrochitiniphilus]|uniref:PLP-dependent aminotransferase family protein n=1 Tax=Arthrobacter psychrochitiniphilus TaxID=291045 RepID=A0A2V3DRQ0_9MICC|nr:PLP-dependent aminotransferase family protein [Arthrobacter psychrochitiniphilus]NYG16941.1 DNA-binding transcriptional MocR family regulator [Arthrobacter psychrochitiniphilus]PXA64824.1 PLP-dependent aminotransferase family protein [Arthrobacter psychrochitiniphilus]